MSDVTIPEIGFGKALAQTAALSVVAVVGTAVGIAIVGYSFSKIEELRENHAAKKAQKA